MKYNIIMLGLFAVLELLSAPESPQLLGELPGK